VKVPRNNLKHALFDNRFCISNPNILPFVSSAGKVFVHELKVKDGGDMGEWLYAFAAKEIQKYILQGNKLKDMVGGSELVNQMCGEFLTRSLNELGIDNSEYRIITQTAGWARIQFNNGNDAKRLYTVWPLLVDRFVPGLQVVQSLVEINGDINNAIEESEKKLRAERSLIQVGLPEIGPLIERNQRLGFAAVRYAKGEDELQDRQTTRKRDYVGKRKNKSAMTTLVAKMSGAEDTEKQLQYRWPDELDDIAGSEKKYIAVIHADGNDLGKTIRQLQEHVRSSPDKAIDVFKRFSEAISQATESAAQEAYKRIIKPDYEDRAEVSKKPIFMAARPIVLGGDDLTLIIRADLAFKFTRVFMEAFEASSKEALEKELGGFNIAGLPEKLTSCAGIAFIKKAYPFSRAYELAESLCAFAKSRAKEKDNKDKDGFVPSSFAFYKVATSVAGSYSLIRETELTSKDSSEALQIKLWHGPYTVGSHDVNLVSYDDLVTLAGTLSKLPSGSIRTLITTVYTSALKAQTDFDRILQVAGSTGKKEIADKFKAQLIKITGNTTNPLWNENGNSPLLDAYRIRELSDDTVLVSGGNNGKS